MPLELDIRSFAIRGCLLEEDIVTGSADAIRVIFVGLFGRFAQAGERRLFSFLLVQEFNLAMERVLSPVANFMKAFPNRRDRETRPFWAITNRAEHRFR